MPAAWFREKVHKAPNGKPHDRVMRRLNRCRRADKECGTRSTRAKPWRAKTQKRRDFHLGGDVLLELLYLVVHDLELALHLGDLVLRLDQILAVEVSVAPHALVQLLLLLQLYLPIANLVAELVYAHLTELCVWKW